MTAARAPGVPVRNRLRRDRRAVAAIFTVHGAVCGSFSTRIPWIEEHLHIGAGALGVALLAPTVGSLLTMPMAGRLAHRLGGTAATRLLIAVFCCTVAGPALAPDLPVLCVCMTAYGAMAGMSDVVMNAQGVAVEQRAGRSIMSGLHGMWSAGGLAGGAVGAWAAQAGIDARVHLAAVAAALLLAGLTAGLWLPHAPREPLAEPPPRFVLPHRGILVIGLIGFCAIFCESAGQNWCAVYLKQITHASPGVAAACYTAFAFSMAIGRLGGDLVIRRLGPVWSVRISGAIAASGAAAVIVARTPGTAIAGFMGIGLGVAVIVPLVFVAAANAAPSASEGVAGVATIAYSAEFAAPSTIGLIGAAFSLSGSFVVVTALAATILLSAGAMPRRRAPAGPVPATVSAAEADHPAR